jgi:UDP-N-acetylglucosamine--dolichyl-phosphate N-acetylglucosaminephosphotransferase
LRDMSLPNPINVEMIGLALLISIVVFATTLILMPYLIKRLKRSGIIGIDYHKIARPKIPEMGGTGIVVALAVGGVLAFILVPETSLGTLSAILVMATGAIVGLVDDLKKLGPKTKPILTAVACWPILLFQTYDPHPVFPFIGGTRLTVLYPIMIPIGTAMAANAVNMLDVLNGAMPSTCIPVAIALLVGSIILGSTEGMILSAILASVLLAYYKFNKYPAKVFTGDVGSLAVGATIAAIAVVGQLEVITVVAMIPFIMNSFHSLASIGHLFERRQIRTRPTFLQKDGRIAANTDSRSPLTLTRIIVGKVPLREYEVVRVLFILSAFSSVLAILTTLFLSG